MPKAPQQDSYFIQKLYQTIRVQPTITQHSSHEVIEWDFTGKSFIVNDERAFTNNVLASEFGIGRFDSFARKLNKYGFKRSKVQGNRVRFFHKQFSRDGKLLNRIRKLSKEETLPKHIKLQLIRQQRLQGSIKTQINDQSPKTKVNSDLTWIGTEDEPQQSRSDIGMYLNKQVEMASIIKPSL